MMLLVVSAGVTVANVSSTWNSLVQFAGLFAMALLCLIPAVLYARSVQRQLDQQTQKVR